MVSVQFFLLGSFVSVASFWALNIIGFFWISWCKGGVLWFTLICHLRETKIHSSLSAVTFECSHTAELKIYTQENKKGAVILGSTRLETGKTVLISSLHLSSVAFRIYKDLEGVWFNKNISPDWVMLIPLVSFKNIKRNFISSWSFWNVKSEP